MKEKYELVLDHYNSNKTIIVYTSNTTVAIKKSLHDLNTLHEYLNDAVTVSLI